MKKVIFVFAALSLFPLFSGCSDDGYTKEQEKAIEAAQQPESTFVDRARCGGLVCTMDNEEKAIQCAKDECKMTDADIVRTSQLTEKAWCDACEDEENPSSLHTCLKTKCDASDSEITEMVQIGLIPPSGNSNTGSGNNDSGNTGSGNSGKSSDEQKVIDAAKSPNATFVDRARCSGLLCTMDDEQKALACGKEKCNLTDADVIQLAALVEKAWCDECEDEEGSALKSCLKKDCEASDEEIEQMEQIGLLMR